MYTEALAAPDRWRQIAEGFAALDPKNATNIVRMASVYHTRAGIEASLHRYPEALEQFRKKIATWDRLTAIDPLRRSPKSRMRTAVQGKDYVHSSISPWLTRITAILRALGTVRHSLTLVPAAPRGQQSDFS